MQRVLQILRHIPGDAAKTAPDVQKPKALETKKDGSVRSDGHAEAVEARAYESQVVAVEPGSVGQQQEPSVGQMRWNGWGFPDSEFKLNSEGLVELVGSRYVLSGKVLPGLRKWFEENAGLDINFTSPSQTAEQAEAKVKPGIKNEAFLAAIQDSYSRISFSARERLFHGRGHTAEELAWLRYGEFKRLPDVVIYPGSHEHVERIVAAAVQHNCVIIPFGGGTNVTQALLCPVEEKRMIISLDMHDMNNITWIDRASMRACIQAGATGREIEKKLSALKLTLGHEPDSVEFSTMGGWVATRASGMKKNAYGNIEDFVLQIKMVTPKGTWTKSAIGPRTSTGSDIYHMMMGSEGTIGVVTEVVVRLRPAPECTKYGAMLFPNFENGVECLREIAIKRAAPVSIRLVDNVQFHFGQSLTPRSESKVKDTVEKAKKWYVVNRLGFDPNVMCAATLQFEGTKDQIEKQEAAIFAIASKYGGISAGAEAGFKGYFLTYVIAYLRDFALNYCWIAESFETSAPWNQVLPMCINVKERIRQSCAAHKVQNTPFISCRVTQTYDTGACVYFYTGFVSHGLKDPVATYTAIEHDARNEILKYGGTLSHHHGIGKLRKEWMAETVGSIGLTALRAVKQELDPSNVFACGNAYMP